MARHIELNPVSHLTIGTVSPPGQRTFFLQGRRGSQTISLIMEKEQARMLADSFESLIVELEQKYPTDNNKETGAIMDMRLQAPVEPLFRIGNMGLGFDENTRQIVLVAYELVDEGEEPNVVSFWSSREHVQALAQHIREVVKAGRPVCGNCGGPIDADGHFCPQRNGHTI